MASLDADQTKAAAHRVGTAAVAAAAGSGKTTLLVGRAIQLVRSGERAEAVLTLAFNRNAAETLRQRFAQDEATRASASAMASTFHAFALKLCKAWNPKLNVLPQSAAEAASMRGGGRESDHKTLRDIARDVWRGMGGETRGPSRPPLVANIDLDRMLELEPGARERLWAYGWPELLGTPEQLPALREALSKLRLEATEEELAALAPFMQGFRTARRKADGVDFTDMLTGAATLIKRQHPQVMTQLRAIRHLQVDEAQDGNELRWFIARTVADMKEGRSVMAVGDLRQSIAGFAGAQPALFKAWWDSADGQFTLPRNYRSASRIVSSGNIVAAGESWNIGGDSIAAREDLGLGKVRVEDLPAMNVAVEIASLIQEGVLTQKQVTVLARTRAALEPIAFGLRAKGLKAFVRGGGGAWRGRDGQMLRAYLDFSEGFTRNAKMLGTALNRPLRYVSAERLTGWLGPELRVPSIAEPVRKLGGKLYRDAEQNYRPALAVVEAFEELSTAKWEERVELVESWLIEGLAEEAREQKGSPDENSDRADLIRNLCTIAKVCGSVANLDVAIAAEARVDPKDLDVIELSTIHQSKGDQWERVYVTGFGNGAFPSARAKGEEEQAEEVRLLYVAVTRPVSTLVLCSTGVEAKTGLPVEAQFNEKMAEIATLVDEDEEDPTPLPPRPPTMPSKALMTLAQLREKVQALLSKAEAEGTSAPAPAPGTRFVTVLWSQLLGLLAEAGFEELPAERGQRVLGVMTSDGHELRVYSSVPPGEYEARGNGEDSIRVVHLQSGQPTKRKPYVARTRGWRASLIKRIVESLA